MCSGGQELMLWMSMMRESSTLQSVCHDYFDFACDGDQKVVEAYSGHLVIKCI